MIEQKNDKRIRLIIEKFDKTFIKTINNDPSLKKGGLRGLAAVTIGISLNEKLAANLFPLIIDPVLKCLKD